MNETIGLEIKAASNDATRELNRAAASLDKLSKSLSAANGISFKPVATGIRELADATKYFNQNTKMSYFTRFAKSINKINEVDTAKIQTVSNALVPLAQGMTALGNVSFDGSGLKSLTSALRSLSNLDVSGVNSANFTQVGQSIKQLATALVDTPTVSRNVISFTNAIAKLGMSGQYISATVSYLPALGSTLKGVITSISAMPGVDATITSFVSALGQLASAGNRAATVTNALVPMANQLKEVMRILQTAPNVNANVLKMVSALGQLASSGSKAGSMARSLGRSMTNLGTSFGTTSKKAFSLASAIGKLYATYWLLFRAIKVLGKSVSIASSLTEVENVVQHSFGNMRTSIDNFTKDAIDKFGMGELASRQYASRYMAMGNAMGITNSAVAKSNEFLANKLKGSEDAYKNLGTTMGDMAVNITKLAADYASFYDVSQEETTEKMQAIFTGMTKPLRAYGIDLTQATLKEWALKNGLDADIDSMTQAEKTMLRYQYVMANSKNIMGDFARTSDTWHNVMVKIRANLQNLAGTIGGVLINAFKPLMIWINNAIKALNEFAIVVANSLGKIFGWTYETGTGGITVDVENAADAADDLASGTGTAAKNAKEFKKQLQGIDELNNLTLPDDNKGGGKGGGSGNGYDLNGSAADVGGKWKKTASLFESDWDTFYKLGAGIGEKISSVLDGIKWGDIYEKAKDFGTNLASFLNGLISPDLFKSFADTITGSLNTALNFFKSFGDTFGFDEFGTSVGEAINGLFTGFDWVLFADTLNTWVDGVKEAISAALKTISLKEIVEGLGTFLTELELDTFTIGLGVILWKLGGEQMALSAMKNVLATQLATGIGDLSISLGAAIGLSIAVAIVGFKIGNWLYENCDTIESISDAIAEWMFKDVEDGVLSIPKTLTVALGGLAISFGAMKGIMWLVGGRVVAGTALKSAITGIASSGFASALGSAVLTLGTLAAQVGLVIAVALGGLWIGKKYYEKVTGEEAAGGIKDLIDMDATLSEIGQAISDGAVLDITITPLLRLISGDDSISTEEVINAMELMLEDFMETVKKVASGVGAIGIKLQDLWNSCKKLGNNLGNALIDGWNMAKPVWSKVATFFTQNVINPISNGFTNLKNTIVNAFSSTKNAVAQGWSAVATWFNQYVITPIATTFNNLRVNITNNFANALASVKNAWGGITQWFSSLNTGISSVFSGIAVTIKNAFTVAFNAVKQIWNGVGSYFKSVANSIIKPIGNAINGVISGINWVLTKVNSKTQLTKWTIPQYANGTNGLDRDQIGMVNDQKGSTYREMIIPPNGQPFIPKGRNVLLDMKKGTKIMPASQTKAFMNGIPRFENGVGDALSGLVNAVKSFTGDVMDYSDKPGDLMKVAIGKFVKVDAKGTIAEIARGAVNKVFDSSVAFLKSMFNSLGGGKVNKAVKWALNIANDNRHGYDQGNRWGTPDYDCSSFVISAFQQAGIPLKSGGATYTGNLMRVALANGFKDVTKTINKATGGGIKKGDILLNHKHHTALALGGGKLVHASANEFGKAFGGKAGDQTGREIYSKGYYNYPWDVILRFKGFKNGIGRIVPSDFSGFFASGGFPEDGWFRANHEELIGKFDNGRTVVANNQQITEGISSAVYQGNLESNALLRQQNALMQEEIGLMREFVNKEFGISVDDVGTAVRKYNANYKMINGRNIFA